MDLAAMTTDALEALLESIEEGTIDVAADVDLGALYDAALTERFAPARGVPTLPLEASPAPSTITAILV